MKLYALMSVLSLTLLQLNAAEKPVELKTINTYQDKIYELVTLSSEIEMAPLWKEEQENPPLSARAAVKIAQQYVAKHVPNSERWDVSVIMLTTCGTREGQWMYNVSFAMHDGKAPILGTMRGFQVPVLLNGSTPKVTIKDVQR
jgi:hypothetical protein